MQPGSLKPEDFSKYPQLARELAVNNISLLQAMPLAFLPLLLRELIRHDWNFPAERNEIDSQFTYLLKLSSEQRVAEFAPFAALKLSPELEQMDWVNEPATFSERLSAYLWSSKQMDAFRAASLQYVERVHAATPRALLSTYRLGIVVLGAGVAQSQYPLFRKLRPHGTYFTNVDAADGLKALDALLGKRANEHPAAFAHWYISGAQAPAMPGITQISYNSLEPIRFALINKMRDVMQPGHGGPEYLRTLLARMRPEDFGLDAHGEAAVLNRFQVSVLTEGSGTQLFSTTFVQWSAREALRRAQPLTLFTRFTPRQHEDSMRELLAGGNSKPRADAIGSLIDADMGAYYTWINLQRLGGADNSRFLVWFENHKEVLAIGPKFRSGAVNNEPSVALDAILSNITA